MPAHTYIQYVSAYKYYYRIPHCIHKEILKKAGQSNILIIITENLILCFFLFFFFLLAICRNL